MAGKEKRKGSRVVLVVLFFVLAPLDTGLAYLTNAKGWVAFDILFYGILFVVVCAGLSNSSDKLP
jgi:hypothetical protein